MTSRTSIEWTLMPGYVGSVWNPAVGCTRVSAGCQQCYAFALHDRRYKANRDASRASGDASIADTRRQQDEADDSDVRPLPFPKQYDLPFSRVQLLEDRLDVPLRTRKPTCYFVDSMADLFHEDLPDDYLMRVFHTMRSAHRHKFLVLTKRPERMRRFMHAWVTDAARYGTGEPPANVWLGTSVEDQNSADERIPHLLATPAAVRFLSCEPLLGPVDLSRHVGHPSEVADGLEHLRLHWLIIGGESGAHARPMDLAWARSLVEQCRTAGIAVFVKQLGSSPHGRTVAFSAEGSGFRGQWTTAPMKLRESHGRDMSEWPEDLRIREWPR